VFTFAAGFGALAATVTGIAGLGCAALVAGIAPLGGSGFESYWHGKF